MSLNLVGILMWGGFFFGGGRIEVNRIEVNFDIFIL